MVTENMVRGLDEDESSFLDEVSRQQCLVEKQRRDEEKKELLEYRISFIFKQRTYIFEIGVGFIMKTLVFVIIKSIAIQTRIQIRTASTARYLLLRLSFTFIFFLV